MKKLLIFVWCLMLPIAVLAGGEIKKTCHPLYNKKGHPLYDKHHRQLQHCKTIIVHKKLEGNVKVPTH